MEGMDIRAARGSEYKGRDCRMELRLLNCNLDDLVEPDGEAIDTVLRKIPSLSGEKRPRAVLVGDNGIDFIQFFLMDEEECREFAGGS